MGGVERWISAVEGVRNEEGLRRTEAKYEDREARMKRCEVKIAVEVNESVESSESSEPEVRGS